MDHHGGPTVSGDGHGADAPVLLQSPSRAFDGAAVALEGMTAAAPAALGTRWRLVGGMTLLTVRLLAPQQPDQRYSADADLGVDVAQLGEAPLLVAMRSQGFEKVDGSRLRKVAADVEANVDLLGAADHGRFGRNVPAGDFVVDVTPALGAALRLPARVASVRALLTDGSTVVADDVLLPHPVAALALKVHAWQSLKRTQDADDVAALLRSLAGSGARDADVWTLHPDLTVAREDLRRRGQIWAPHMVRDAGWTSADVAELKYCARTIT